MLSSRGSSQPRDWTQVFRIAGEFFTIWATRETQGYCNGYPFSGGLLDPGIELAFHALQSDPLPAELPGMDEAQAGVKITRRNINKLRRAVDTTLMTLTFSFPTFEPIRRSMSNSTCCFLTCTQVLQEAGKVVCYSHLLKNFPVSYRPYSQKLYCSLWSKSRCFPGIPLLFLWSTGCWQFDFWFLCLF